MDALADQIENVLQLDPEYEMPLVDLRRLTVSVCCVNLIGNKKRSVQVEPSDEQIKLFKSLQRLCLRFEPEVRL